PTYSQAIASLILPTLMHREHDTQVTTQTLKKTKTQRILDEQTQKITGYTQSATENQQKGELIFQHYTLLQKHIETLKKLKAKGGWEAAKAYAAQHGMTLNEQDSTITIDLP
ncbi:MAG: hypothetical protein HC945_01085, partial [Nitrosarchaeum sp.]|nr:hypothetical protein [Nitrosarchaeum sp.]